MALQSVSPATGEVIATYDEAPAPDVAAIIVGARYAHMRWRRSPFDERAAVLRAAARLLREATPRLARLITDEMGKAIRESRAEVEKCAWVCDYYADEAEHQLADAPIPTDASRSYVTYQPLGVVLAVMPWNFPFWQVFRFLAPALMAGNGVLVKHASNVTGCSLAIEDLVGAAGAPQGLVRALVLPSSRVAEVIDHPLVAAATLTGSTAAGSAVAQRAGRLVKKTVLELGGSDPYLVLADADLAPTAEACAASRLINAGQSCIAAKRFIVVNDVRAPFEEALAARMMSRVVGDPTREDVDVGPLARRDLRAEVHQQVARSVELGARLLFGGEIPVGRGAFYPPTLITDVAPGMPAYDEEVFGPVAAVIPARDEEEAIRIANDSVFGLGAAVFSRDTARAERIARLEIEAGCCFVNAFVRSDPRLPFGGVKQSGFGRELSALGIREFTNAKTVYVA